MVVNNSTSYSAKANSPTANAQSQLDMFIPGFSHFDCGPQDLTEKIFIRF